MVEVTVPVVKAVVPFLTAAVDVAEGIRGSCLTMVPVVEPVPAAESKHSFRFTSLSATAVAPPK